MSSTNIWSFFQISQFSAQQFGGNNANSRDAKTIFLYLAQCVGYKNEKYIYSTLSSKVGTKTHSA